MRPAVLLLLATLFLAACGNNRKAPQESAQAPVDSSDLYSLEVVKDRKMKDLDLLRGEHSPIDQADRERFQGLAYFAPDRGFAFETALRRFAKPEPVVMATSKQRPRNMLCIGELPFTYQGASYALRVFTSTDPAERNEWFIPFTDATNGTDTYAAGRFLDVSNARNDSTFLDFNYAYNPYCAYSHRYDCPIPPKENALPFAVRAGEKNYPLHGKE
jgi:uncharacterized protein